MEDLERAVALLEEAQEGMREADGDLKGDIGLILAQILWTIGTEETKDAAKTAVRYVRVVHLQFRYELTFPPLKLVKLPRILRLFLRWLPLVF
ncbi:hypothetical protein FRC02_007483 [Tulasnella sp. 418]|nr:hypothetical protein FRC02_007483 [Tulasnella sp. 418]